MGSGEHGIRQSTGRCHFVFTMDDRQPACAVEEDDRILSPEFFGFLWLAVRHSNKLVRPGIEIDIAIFVRHVFTERF